MEFPLAERELTRLAKNKRMYLLRVAPAICAAAIASVVAPIAAQGSPFNVADALSGVFTWLATLFQLIVLALVVPVTASGQIAREKEERTLGLLMLADLRGGDVFLSKFTAVTVNAWLLILSTLPLLGIAAFLGGVSVPEAAAQVLVALACAAAVASSSLLASALVEKAQTALGLAMAFFLAFVLLTMALDAMARDLTGMSLRLSPFAVLFGSASWTGLFYWLPSALASLMFAALLGLWTTRLLPELAQDKPARGRPARPVAMPAHPLETTPAQTAAEAAAAARAPITAPRREGFGTRHHLLRRLFLGRNQAAYLFRAVMEPHFGRSVLFVLLSVVLLVFGSCLGALIVSALLAHSIVTPVRKFFDEGGFDDLLLAAADPDLLAGGLYRVLLYRALPFIVPLGLVAGALSALPTLGDAPFDGEVVFILLSGVLVGMLQLAFAVALAATEAFLKRKASSAVTAATMGVALVQIGASVLSMLMLAALNAVSLEIRRTSFPLPPEALLPGVLLSSQVLVYCAALASQWRSYRRTFARKVG